MSFVRLSDGRLRGRGVTLTTDPSQARRDRYGRLLAYAKTDAGTELGHRQVRRGWGKVYVFARPFRRVTSYRNAQAAARSERRGVWGACGGNFHRASAFVDRDCEDFASQADAQRFFEANGGGPARDPHRLDADGDGVACEAM